MQKIRKKIRKIWPKWAKMAKMGQNWPKFHKSAHNSAYWRHGANFFTVLERTHIGHPGNTKKSAKNQPQIGQKRPKSAKIGQNPTKVPITRPIEDMTPSFLQFWNAHTWGSQEMQKKSTKRPKNRPKSAKIRQNQSSDINEAWFWQILADFGPFFCLFCCWFSCISRAPMSL